MIRHRRSVIRVDGKSPPIVEIDSSSHAAYVRVSKKKVAKTMAVSDKRGLITMDLAASGEVVGIELVGIKEFGIRALAKRANIKGFSAAMYEKTKYVPVEAKHASE